MTLIHIETDVFQTWQFDFIYKKSFIERKHVTDDIIGNHTTPENIETGEYIIDWSTKDYDLIDLCYMINVTTWLNGNEPDFTNVGRIPMTRWFLYL